LISYTTACTVQFWRLYVRVKLKTAPKDPLLNRNEGPIQKVIKGSQDIGIRFKYTRLFQKLRLTRTGKMAFLGGILAFVVQTYASNFSEISFAAPWDPLLPIAYHV